MAGEPAAPTGIPRAVLDTSVLISAHRHWLWVAAQMGLFEGVWSTFIVAELARVRFRMTLTECVKRMSVEDCLKNTEYRRRIIDLVHQLSDVLDVADYRVIVLGHTLPDPDDDPVLATALAGRARYVVSLNTRHFPAGGATMGVRYVTPSEYAAMLATL